MIEVRNTTLDRIKSHILGRDETGAVEEPMDVYSSDTHPLTRFEGKVRDYVTKPWSLEDLKTQCSKCETESETTQTRHFEKYSINNDWTKYIQYDTQNLCDGCYDATLQQLHAQVKEAREQGEKKETSRESCLGCATIIAELRDRRQAIPAIRANRPTCSLLTFSILRQKERQIHHIRKKI